MIRSFASKDTARIFAGRMPRRLPVDIRHRAMMRLNQLAQATSLDDLRFPPSNRLEPLKGKRAGRWSIRINKQWRLCFHFEAGDAFDVEIIDYH